MGDWPTEEEEFELMYGDEMDLLREQDDDLYEPISKPNKVRKSPSFNSPQTQIHKNSDKPTQLNAGTSQSNSPEIEFGGINNQTSPNQLSGSVNEFNTGQSQNSVSLFSNQTQNDSILGSNNHFSTEPTSMPLFSNQTQNNHTESMFTDIENSQNRKRTTEDLFGDIQDIMLDEEITRTLSQPKRLKTDKNTEELKLIEKIVNMRNEYKSKHTILSNKNYNKNSADNIERDKRNLSLRLPKYPFLALTRHNGIRIYVRFHSEDYEKDETIRLLGENSYFGVRGGSFQKIWDEARDLICKENITTNPEPNTELEILNPEDQEDQKLWVELYKPRKYYELLSDESTNRTMLRWMKLWDKIVFKRNPKIKPMVAFDPNDRKSFFERRFELNTKLDEHGRPEHKVALLCGPPGLGKTTLAHMVAKHAGYNVVEINASDDRSPEAFKKALETATEMRSVVDQEQRPNCIVFDEIDGAPPSSIDFLVKFITGTVKTKSKKGGKKQETQILKRPIICICNDVYVPALRPLRQIAFVVNFPKVSSARLAERLMEIARRQQIKTDLGAMLALAEKSNHDVRSCLSVLHFFKAQNKPIGLSDVYRASIGQKDMQRGLFSVWQEIFEIKKTKSQNGFVVASPKERMDTILSTMSAFGDHERVSQGVYENFPLLPKAKFDLTSCQMALDWFMFNDLVQRQIYTTQNYSMMGYLNFAFVVWHFVFGRMQRTKLVYPSAGYEARTKENRQKAIIQEILRGMAPSARSHNQVLTLILDVLPLIIKIIVPPLRPVNLTLYKEEEKKSFLHVVGVMIDYSLNYVQERTPQGIYEFSLEPNIEEIVIFKALKNVKRREMTYPNKQLIAREIELEKIRRIEAQMVGDRKEKKTKALPNHLQTLKKVLGGAKGQQQKVVKKDFFGREIEITSPVGKTGAVLPKNDIWYCYKEGYSNAVRKKIKVSELK